MGIRKTIYELKPLKRPMGAALRGTLLFFSGDYLELYADTNLKRGAYKEPFDVASHIGNAREGAMITMVAGAMIGIGTLFPAAAMEKEPHELKKRARFTALGAFACSSVVQAIGEGFSFTNDFLHHNTGDPLDAAYGIAWSAIVALSAYKMASGYINQYAERRAETEAEPEQWPQNHLQSQPDEPI